jgi:hypothetical protein
MRIRFEPLFSVAATHAYYQGPCRDIGFVVPRDSAQTLLSGRLVAKVLEGTLRLFFDVGEDDAPLVRVVGQTVRIGLTLLNRSFGNFTAMGSTPGATLAVYRNDASPTALDAPIMAVLRGQVLAHPLADPARPVTVTLESATGGVVAAETVTAVHGRTSVSFDLMAQPSGAYVVREQYPGNIHHTTTCYVDPELARAGVFGVVEITIDAGFYAAAPEFPLAFDARQETLKYYLVVRGYSPAEVGQLAVSDAGFSEDARPEVTFTRVEAGAFAPGDLPAPLLANGDATVVLFQSQAPVARREKGRRRIQLSRNGEVLIGNLPQPGAERANADLIVHLSRTP